MREHCGKKFFCIKIINNGHTITSEEKIMNFLGIQLEDYYNYVNEKLKYLITPIPQFNNHIFFKNHISDDKLKKILYKVLDELVILSKPSGEETK